MDAILVTFVTALNSQRAAVNVYGIEYNGRHWPASMVANTRNGTWSHNGHYEYTYQR